MPVISCALKELPEHLFRPLLNQLALRILDNLSLTDVVGDKIYINADWSSHSNTGNLEKDAILNQQGLRIDANIQLNPTSQKWDVYTFRHTTAYMVGYHPLHDNYPIYLDEENKVRLVEMRSPITMTLNCKLTIRSADIAFTVPQQIFGEHENGSVFHFTDLAFDYPVPKPIIRVLGQFWKMDRDYGQSAGIRLKDYIMQRCNNTWSFHKHRELNEYELVVPSVNAEALATLEYSDDKPEGVLEGRLPVAWEIPFVYTVQMEMPTQFLFQYPMIYNNQQIPDNCIPKPRNNRINALHGQLPNIAVDQYNTEFHRTNDAYVHFPYYDDWVPPTNCKLLQEQYLPFLIMAITVDENWSEPDENGNKHLKKTVLNLADFNDDTATFTPAVKEILYQQGEYSLLFNSIYNVSLFRDNKQLIEYKDFTFNRDLELSFQPYDLRSQYHLVFSSKNNIEHIYPYWIPLMKKYFVCLNPQLKQQIVASICDGLWHGPSKAEYRNGEFIKPSSSNVSNKVIKESIYPDHVDIDINGNIYDNKGNIISSVQECIWPLVIGFNLPEITKSGDVIYKDNPCDALIGKWSVKRHGANQFSRTVEYSIVTRPTKRSETGTIR